MHAAKPAPRYNIYIYIHTQSRQTPKTIVRCAIRRLDLNISNTEPIAKRLHQPDINALKLSLIMKLFHQAINVKPTDYQYEVEGLFRFKRNLKIN
jgi:hypothetical protein